MSAVVRRPARLPAKVRPPIVLDSSCWLEFFADSDRADLFAAAIENTAALVVPVVTVYEVTKKLAREAGEEVAAAALSLMQRGQVIAVDLPLAVRAAANGLPLAESLIYATAQACNADLWTQDSRFEGMAGVRVFVKPQPLKATAR